MPHDLDDIVDSIKDEKINRARINPIRIIGIPCDANAWIGFYERFWSTDEGASHLKQLASRRI